ncbi:MAG: DUF6106 family protein [Clostridia bacterium]|nr:DUF6106 family protein [Clostridia bacterium]
MEMYDSGSIFLEYAVKKKLTVKEVCIRSGIILLGILFFWLSLTVNLGMFGLIVAVWFSYFIISQRRLEFEYSLKGTVLDVYKIMSKSRRRKLIPLELTRLEKFGKIGDLEYNHQLNIKTKVLDFSSGDKKKTDEMYYCVVTRPKGKFMVIIEPGKEVLEAMQAIIPKYL